MLNTSRYIPEYIRSLLNPGNHWKFESVGTISPESNMPPYLKVYCWKR